VNEYSAVMQWIVNFRNWRCRYYIISHNVGTIQPPGDVNIANSDVNNHSRDSVISIGARLEAGRSGVWLPAGSAPPNVGGSSSQWAKWQRPQAARIILNLVIIIIFSGSAAQRGLWPPQPWGFLITQNDAPQSVELLWTSDPRSSAKFKNMCSQIFTSPHALMVRRLIQYIDQFTLLLEGTETLLSTWFNN
jgi:hypothetical protein